MKAIMLLAVTVLLLGCICCDKPQPLDLIPPDQGNTNEYDTQDNNGLDPTTTYPKPTTVQTEQTTTTTQITDNRPELEKIIDTGEPYYCTFTDKKTLSETWKYQLWSKNWKYYTSIDMGRGRVTHILYDQQYQYVWYKGTTQGIKFPIEKIQGMTGNVNTQQQESGQQVWYLVDYLNPQDAKDLNCKKEDVDDSKFKHPPNVRFQEGKSRYDYTDND